MKKIYRFFLIFIISLLLIIPGIYFYLYSSDSITLAPGEIPAVPFYFIRHGQTDDNAHSIISGLLDTPLNATGIAQADAAAQLLEKTTIQTIVTSPLQRAYKTAEIIAKKLDKPIIVMDEFKERSAGNLDGQPEGPWLLTWIFGKTEIPGAESYTDFIKRIIKGLKKALLLPGPVLIVAHGGIFYIMQNLLPLNNKQLIDNATPLLISPQVTESVSWEGSRLTSAA